MATEPKKQLETLDIIPIGMVDRTPLEYLAIGLKIRFGRQTEILPDLQLADPGTDKTRGQWLASTVLKTIVPRPGAWRTLAMMSEDLYAPGLSFVFGEADAPAKKAVFSIHRLRPEHAGEPADRELLFGRCLKEAVHELGHTLGLAHCRDRFCVMRFSNSLIDTDLKRDQFCERCRRSAVHNLSANGQLVGAGAAAGVSRSAR
jgi:archaemetzincin